MERLYQMNVVPDVLPAINPSLDLRVVVRARSTLFIEENKRNDHVEPGIFIRPKQVIPFIRCVLSFLISSLQTIEPPKLRVNVFHTDTRLYTMLMVDPGKCTSARCPGYVLTHFSDVPDPENQTYTTFLHWLK